MGTKTRLWRVCVFSILRYSLCHVGVPSNGRQLIQQAVHRQVRLIAKSPAHVWHVSSADILARLRVEDPWTTFCREVQARRPALLCAVTGVVNRAQVLSSSFLPQSSDSPASFLEKGPSQSVTASMSAEGSGSTAVFASHRSGHTARLLQCPWCQQVFSSLAAMRVTATVQHKPHNDDDEGQAPIPPPGTVQLNESEAANGSEHTLAMPPDIRHPPARQQ